MHCDGWHAVRLRCNDLPGPLRSELIEAHAADTYQQFASQNRQLLQSLPPPLVAVKASSPRKSLATRPPCCYTCSALEVIQGFVSYHKAPQQVINNETAMIARCW